MQHRIDAQLKLQFNSSARRAMVARFINIAGGRFLSNTGQNADCFSTTGTASSGHWAGEFERQQPALNSRSNSHAQGRLPINPHPRGTTPPHTVPPARPVEAPGVRHSCSPQCATPTSTRVPGGAASIGHAAGEQAARRVEAAKRMGDEVNFVLMKTKFV